MAFVEDVIAFAGVLILVEFGVAGDGEDLIVDEGDEAVRAFDGGEVVFDGDRVDALGDGADAGDGNAVSGEDVTDPAAARELAKGGGVVDGTAGDGPVEGIAKGGGGAEEAAEVTLIELGEGGVAIGSAEAVVSLAVLFVGEVEEGFVASVVELGDDDGAADAAGPVHLAVLRTVDAARVVGEGVGVEGFVANAGVGAAVEGVGAGLHDVVEDAALAAAEFGGHAPGLDFDFGEGFDGDRTWGRSCHLG